MITLVRTNDELQHREERSMSDELRHSERGLPICETCGKEFRFDLDEPFAVCGCPGVSEWGHNQDGDRYRRIETRLISEEHKRSRRLKALAQKMHDCIDQLGDHIEAFNNAGGQVNLRVYHNQGSESIDLHELNGEFEGTYLKVEEITID